MWPASDGQPTHIPATGMTRCGSFEHLAHLRRMIADHADRAGAEPHRVGGADEARQHDAGIDRGVEELIEMIVGERLAAHFRDFRQPPAVRQEHQERRRGADERLVGDEIGDRRLVRLARRSRCRPAAGRSCSAPTARRRRAAAADRRSTARSVIAPVHAAAGEAGQLVEAGEIFIDRECFAEAPAQRIANAAGCGSACSFQCSNLSPCPSILSWLKVPNRRFRWTCGAARPRAASRPSRCRGARTRPSSTWSPRSSATRTPRCPIASPAASACAAPAPWW